MMQLKICSICSEPKYIGFINFITRQKYRLCQKHYYEWIQTKTSIDMFIRVKKNDKGQTKLEVINV